MFEVGCCAAQVMAPKKSGGQGNALPELVSDPMWQSIQALQVRTVISLKAVTLPHMEFF